MDKKAILKTMVSKKKDETGGPGFQKLQKMMPLKIMDQMPLKERLPNLLPKNLKFKGKLNPKYPQPTPRRGWADYV